MKAVLGRRLLGAGIIAVLAALPVFAQSESNRGQMSSPGTLVQTNAALGASRTQAAIASADGKLDEMQMTSAFNPAWKHNEQERLDAAQKSFDFLVEKQEARVRKWDSWTNQQTSGDQNVLAEKSQKK